MIAPLLIAALKISVPMIAPAFIGTGLNPEIAGGLYEASPRLIAEKNGTSYATAVVIGRRDNDLFLLTADHALPKDIETSIRLDFFDRGSYPKVSRTLNFGTVAQRFPIPDFALIRFPILKGEYPTVPLAPLTERPKRFPVEALSIGCDRGNIPTWQKMNLLGKRIARKANDEEIAFFFESDRIPSVGRSGGPLFDSQGKLIGICSATTGGRGYYCHVDEILAGLKQKNLGWLIEGAVK